MRLQVDSRSRSLAVLVSTGLRVRMQSLEAELTKLASRTAAHGELAETAMAGVVERLEGMKRSIEAGRSPQWAQLANAMKTTGVKLSDSQKEWYSCLSRLGKTIDKVSGVLRSALIAQKFNADLTPVLPVAPASVPVASTSTEDEHVSRWYFDSPASIAALDEVLAAHFVRQGYPELARTMQRVRRRSVSA